MNFSWCYVKRLRASRGSSSVNGSDVKLPDTSGCDGCLCNARYGGSACSSDGDIANGGGVLTENDDASKRGIDGICGAVVDSR